MNPSSEKDKSIRLRLDPETLERIDSLVGKGARQRFIVEAILWRLELLNPLDIPPTVIRLAEEFEEIKKRLEYLEHIQSTSAYLGELNEDVRAKVCRDDLDRQLLVYILKVGGATTPELAEVLGKKGKRRTILDRIQKLNERAETILGHPILRQEKGTVQGKRGAWWLIDPKRLTL